METDKMNDEKNIMNNNLNILIKNKQTIKIYSQVMKKYIKHI